MRALRVAVVAALTVCVGAAPAASVKRVSLPQLARTLEPGSPPRPPARHRARTDFVHGYIKLGSSPLIDVAPLLSRSSAWAAGANARALCRG